MVCTACYPLTATALRRLPHRPRRETLDTTEAPEGSSLPVFLESRHCAPTLGFSTFRPAFFAEEITLHETAVYSCRSSACRLRVEQIETTATELLAAQPRSPSSADLGVVTTSVRTFASSSNPTTATTPTSTARSAISRLNAPHDTRVRVNRRFTESLTFAVRRQCRQSHVRQNAVEHRPRSSLRPPIPHSSNASCRSHLDNRDDKHQLHLNMADRERKFAMVCRRPRKLRYSPDRDRSSGFRPEGGLPLRGPLPAAQSGVDVRRQQRLPVIPRRATSLNPLQQGIDHSRTGGIHHGSSDYPVWRQIDARSRLPVCLSIPSAKPDDRIWQ